MYIGLQVKLSGVEEDLAVERASLEAASANADLDDLSTAVDDICNNLQVEHPEGANTLIARASRITERARTLERGAFRVGINRAFAVAYSHYEYHINLMALGKGYCNAWEDEDLEALEKAIRPLSDALADGLVDLNFPERLP